MIVRCMNISRASYFGISLVAYDQMKKSRFKDEQIVAILRESEAGTTNAEVCRKRGISNNTLYNWRSKPSVPIMSETKLGE